MKNRKSSMLRQLCFAAAAVLAGAPVLAGSAAAYPLDAGPATGIKRLEGYLYSLKTASGKTNLENGQLMAAGEISPRLEGRAIAVPAVDRRFTEDLKRMLDGPASASSFAVLDLSDLNRPRYAEHNGGRQFVPGSVGKVLVAAALLQALADIHPNDIEARREILRDHKLTADSIIKTDSHEVPFWIRVGDVGRIALRPLEIGDRANLWTYLDWMLSASSNAAASMVIREVVAMRHFGAAYPPADAALQAFYRNTGRGELQRLLSRAMREPISKNGFDPAKLRQGSFFTRGGRQWISSIGSTANVRNLVRLLFAMERGALVDSFSSGELKRLLYLTQKRIRYSASPALNDAAVFFKSGSLYKCRPERGYVCKQFLGNRENYLNSIAVVESPAAGRRLFYIVALSTNVLRKHSSELHEEFAGRVHQAVARHHSGRAAVTSAHNGRPEKSVGLQEEGRQIFFQRSGR